jgi:hypothetical protein
VIEQEIPAGVEVTVPLPVPPPETDSGWGALLRANSLDGSVTVSQAYTTSRAPSTSKSALRPSFFGRLTRHLER